MPEPNEQILAKAQAFFERARSVAQSNNFDYAIDMYLEGLQRAPDAVRQGHMLLRELALLRQGKGGKKPTMVEKMKRARGKSPLEQMINAEYLFAKDPDNLGYARDILKAAIAGEHKGTAGWIADLVFHANNAAEKPSFHTYMLLKDSYKTIGLFDRAIAACQYASQLKPQDGLLADELKNLTAELTVAKGKYDQEGDFRKSIKDRESQEKLQAQQSIVKPEDYRISAIQQARKVFAGDPNLAANIFNLAQALSESQNEKEDNEAVELLENAYKTKSDFSFEQRAGMIRIRQLARKLRQVMAALEAQPDNVQAQAAVAELSSRLNNTELEHYRLCVENYPTDVRLQYECGIRLVRNKQYDEAIPLLQEARKDPRHRIAAMDKIGLCFFLKGWFADAIDIFTNAMELHQTTDDGMAKELRYNLAQSYEQQGQTDKALEIYRRIAQLDFTYKDVSKRVDNLRKKTTDPSSQ